MNKNSFRLQNYTLPIGFAVIILFMIAGAFLTSHMMDEEHHKIAHIQEENNAMNKLLVSMADAEYQRTIILFQLFQDKEKYKTEDLSIDLHYQEVKLANARKEFATYDLSRTQKDYFELQGILSEQNIESMNNLILLFQSGKKEEANKLLNEKTLPEIRHLLRVISRLYEASNNHSKEKTKMIDEISSSEAKKVFAINFGLIFFSFVLMWFLRKKQSQTDTYLSLKANTDQLTGLPNRDSFIQTIDQLIAKEPDSNFSIVFLDLDYFKSINDNYGHKTGDLVLQLFVKSIEILISKKDTLSRFGGDEFVLLLRHTDNIEEVKRKIKRISKALDTSFQLGANEIFISSSIGASTYPKDGDDSGTLLKHADIAMYSSKQNGRNCYQLFSPEDSKKLDREHRVTHALRTILKNNNEDKQLSMVYQPLVNIVDSSFDECEALIRWTDLDGQPIDTVEFIQIAEKSNLIEKLNTFVIEEVCLQQAQWQREGVNNVRININLSGNKRIFSHLFSSFSEKLKEYDLEPRLFGIELTERTIYEISSQTYKELEHFRSIGMKIAIDDFGTGYSSMSYLKELPITSLKIDRAFIVGLPNNQIDIALVKAILTLAHSLNYDVVAEGVETQEQFDFLKESNCNIAQGRLLHYPLKPEKIKLLKLVA